MLVSLGQKGSGHPRPPCPSPRHLLTGRYPVLLVGTSLGEGDSIRGLASLSPRAAGPTETSRCYSLGVPRVADGGGLGTGPGVQRSPGTSRGQESGDLVLTQLCHQLIRKTPLHSGLEGQICWNFKAKYLSVGLPWWFSGKESAFPEDRLGGRWILHYELVTELGQSQVSTQLGKKS